jgi:hypothetical protein
MYGRAGDLTTLNNARNDTSKPYSVRRSADESHATIVKQMKDKKLMNLRLHLIKATKMGDTHNAHKLQLLMQEHQGLIKETGHELS